MIARFRHRVWIVLPAALSLLACAAGASSVPAFAGGCPENSAYTNCAPGWEVATHAIPTNLAPGKLGIVEVAVFNVGAGAAESPITVTDDLPEGLEAKNAGELDPSQEGVAHTGNGSPGIFPYESAGGRRGLWACSGARVVTCTAEPARGLPSAGGGLGAGYPMKIAIEVQVAEHPASQSVVNRVTVAGGGAPAPASTSQTFTLSAIPAPFGFSDWDVWFSNADGTIDTQAGSHPYAATFRFDLNSVLEPFGEAGELVRHTAGGSVNGITAMLPPGLVGDPHAVPQCTRAQLNSSYPGVSTEAQECPRASQIGLLETPLNGFTAYFPVYNMVAPAGAPAEFGFNLFSIPTFIISSVRTGGDYGIDSIVNNVPQEGVKGSTLILWGFPADPSHDYWRAEANAGTRGCNGSFPETCQPQSLSGAVHKPFLTLPTSCAGPQRFSISATTWQNPSLKASASVLTHNSEDEPTGFTGCEHLAFEPVIALAPDTSSADTPAGLTAEVKPPVGGLSEVEGNSTADVQNTQVVLPAGVVVNPGQAAGLRACGPAEDGLTTEAEKAEGKEDAAPPDCPSASKVGTVSIVTPLLSEQLEGNVYVLQSNPPELKLLVAASAEGVNVKLVGTVHLNEATGQLTTTFEGTPELPFTDFKLSFSGGAQAALATPTQCGVYTADADFTPWSSPFVTDALFENSFAIEHGPGGGPCPSSPLPFNPSLIAGATTDQAGGYTNFSLLLQRGDGQQRISGLRFKAPEGLTGFLSKVPLCTNAQAEANECPEASKIGHTVVESGPGPYPLVVPEPGQPPAPIYLTESYGGAPFGLSVVVPLHVGPFVLPTQRVRAKIEVNPYTSALTVTTNPFPQEVAGVPTDLREVDAVIERPEFMVNPTNCDPQEFSGTAYGTPPPGLSEPNQTAAIASHFQVGACQALKFEPKFEVTTSGKTSRADGASLTAKVSYPSVPQGADADIGAVKVELPKQLPSRLTTLQKACTAAQFDANPAGCPALSVVGHAVVHTPLLPVALEGPAYFVSNGGEAFPNLIIALQGDGVTVDLVGDTFISNGITSTTFKTVPDDPFSTFELTLAQGPDSALAANTDLCALTKSVTTKRRVTKLVHGRKVTRTVTIHQTKPGALVMPNEFVAQNGAVLRRDTDISVTGCPKAVSHARKQQHHVRSERSKQQHGSKKH
jgi:hypothetical protein